jgi:hypothetical protein
VGCPVRTAESGIRHFGQGKYDLSVVPDASTGLSRDDFGRSHMHFNALHSNKMMPIKQIWGTSSKVRYGIGALNTTCYSAHIFL